MKDRIPTIPGRVLIHPENGQPDYYAVLSMADDPTQLGTDLNKGNLLSDETAAKLFLPETPEPTVDKALAELAKKARTIQGSYSGNGAAERTINLGLKPLAVILMRSDGFVTRYRSSEKEEYHFGGIALQNAPVVTEEENLTVLSLATDGFTVYEKDVQGTFTHEGAWSNRSGSVYHYIAIVEG